MRTLLFVLFAFALLQSPQAQKEGKAWCDSMLTELPKLKEDTTKVRFIATLCWEMAEYDAPGAIELALKGLKLAEDLGDKYGEGLSHVVAGGCYDLMTKSPEATDHYIKAQPILEEMGEYNLLCTDYLFLVGSFAQLDTGWSMSYFRKARALLPKNTDDQWKERNYGLVGCAFMRLGQFDSARNYIALSINMCEEHGFNWDKNLMLCQMGYFYLNLAEYDSAYMVLQRALTYFKAIDNLRMPAEIYVALGETRFRQSQLDSANRNKYLEEAEASFLQAIEYGKKSRNINSIGWSLKWLSDIYFTRGSYKKAYETFQVGFLYYDSILGPRVIAQTSALSWKYEKQLNEQQMELLKLRNRQQLMINIVTVAGIIILVVVVIFIISNRRKLKQAYLLVNQQKEEIEVQKEEVECQNEELETTLDRLKQTQSQLIQSEKMASLGMLTAGIAHEINNPVNFINSGAISLQKDYEDMERLIQSLGPLSPEAQKIANEIGMEELMKIIPQTIEDIKTGVQRTSEIVKGLRNFTRMDASELKEADLHAGIDSTILLLRHKIKDRIEITKEYDDRIGFINCYPGPLNQVFLNLLNNAIDAIDQKIKEAMPDDLPNEQKSLAGRYQIRIRTELVEQGIRRQVVVGISDNGSGIPDEMRGKLFDPFFTTKEVGKGTGLGLSICQGIMEKHGGTITFESKVNEGTVFMITLPVS